MTDAEPTLKEFIEGEEFAKFPAAPMPTATTADRLEAKHAEKAELKLARDMHDAGFENVDDYHTWRQLEELRKLTKELRTSGGVTVAFDPAGVGMMLHDTELVACPPRTRKRIPAEFPFAG